MANCESLARQLGLKAVLIKDEGRNPTGSLKDRPSALLVIKAREAGARIITTASSGNAGGALAGVCASVGMKSVIFVPSSIPRAKLTQLQVYGSVVVAVEGSYDQTVELCMKAGRHFGWYQRSTGYNPYTREGKKTAALEIAEQLNWRPPDKVFVPMGDGNIASGIWKGFRDLMALGFIERSPRLIGVQAEGTSSIVDAVNGDGVVRESSGSTIAGGINVTRANDPTMAVRAIRESSGFGVKVSDEEIRTAILGLARSSGVFAEPAAAAAFAGLVKSCEAGLVKDGETVLVLITGTGLKDIEAPGKRLSEPLRVAPDLNELERRLGDEGIRR